MRLQGSVERGRGERGVAMLIVLFALVALIVLEVKRTKWKAKYTGQCKKSDWLLEQLHECEKRKRAIGAQFVSGYDAEWQSEKGAVSGGYCFLGKRKGWVHIETGKIGVFIPDEETTDDDA